MMLPRFYYSVLYNLVVLNLFRNTKISRRIQKRYVRSLENESRNNPVLTRTNRQWFICPFSHKLVFYQKDYPFYDKQLAKLCFWLNGQLKREINIIDIGSNVGDTVLNIGLKDAFYLCVEGDERYSKYIDTNLKRRYNYSLERCFLTDRTDERKYSFSASNGTGRLTESNDVLIDNLKTLDELISERYQDRTFDLVKIDTDGFDFKVIRGAKQCLDRWHPLIYFEWDKSYCKEQGEDPLSIFPILGSYGYKKCILFDNFGNLFGSLDTDNTAFLKTIIDNTIGEGLPFYYDVLAVPQNDIYDVNRLLSVFGCHDSSF